jgi:hypothetical protein
MRGLTIASHRLNRNRCSQRFSTARGRNLSKFNRPVSTARGCTPVLRWPVPRRNLSRLLRVIAADPGQRHKGLELSCGLIGHKMLPGEGLSRSRSRAHTFVGSVVETMNFVAKSTCVAGGGGCQMPKFSSQ